MTSAKGTALQRLAKACANSDCPYQDEPEREFYIRPSGRPHARCVSCFKEQVTQNYERTRETKLARERELHAADPERRRSRDRERYLQRRETQSEYLREWKKRNRDRVNAYEAARRARVKGSPETEFIDRMQIYERDGGRCHICERPTWEGDFTLDHLIPLSKGGAHVRTNIAVAHRDCNSIRAAGRLPAQLLLIG